MPDYDRAIEFLKKEVTKKEEEDGVKQQDTK